MKYSSGLINWQWLIETGRIQEATSEDDYIVVASLKRKNQSKRSVIYSEYMIKVSDFLLITGDGVGLTKVFSDTTLTGEGTAESLLSVVPTDVQAEMAFAGSDQTTPLTVVANIAGIFAEFDMTLQSLFAGVGVLGTTSGGTRIMIQKNGVDMLSTPITIDHGDTTSLTATTPAEISVSAITRGDRISVDIQDITIGATEAGLQIVLNGIRA